MHATMRSWSIQGQEGMSMDLKAQFCKIEERSHQTVLELEAQLKR